MKKGFVVFVFFIFLFWEVKGQDTISTRMPEMQTISLANDSLAQKNDSLAWMIDERGLAQQQKIDTEKLFKPDPTKAVLYSIVPGLGQIYNRKYWKLPIIYGGFVALAYGMTWNNRYFTDYKEAYRGIAGDDFNRAKENFDQWKDMAGVNDINDVTPSLVSNLQGQFRRKKDFYRRNRDLCIIGMVALYAATMVDAYVDAHLFDFDISPDLSLKVEPTMMGSSLSSSNKSFGVQCNFTF